MILALHSFLFFVIFKLNCYDCSWKIIFFVAHLFARKMDYNFPHKTTSVGIWLVPKFYYPSSSDDNRYVTPTHFWGDYLSLLLFLQKNKNSKQSEHSSLNKCSLTMNKNKQVKNCETFLCRKRYLDWSDARTFSKNVNRIKLIFMNAKIQNYRKILFTVEKETYFVLSKDF